MSIILISTEECLQDISSGHLTKAMAFHFLKCWLSRQKHFLFMWASAVYSSPGPDCLKTHYWYISPYLLPSVRELQAARVNAFRSGHLWVLGLQRRAGPVIFRSNWELPHPEIWLQVQLIAYSSSPPSTTGLESDFGKEKAFSGGLKGNL